MAQRKPRRSSVVGYKLPRGRPKKRKHHDWITEGPAFPLSDPVEGLALRLRRKVKLHRDQMERYNAMATALLFTGWGPTQRFRQKCIESARALCLFTDQLNTCEEAIRDCDGIDQQEREYVKACNAKYASRGNSADGSGWSVLPNTFADPVRMKWWSLAERVRVCHRNKMRRLKELGFSPTPGAGWVPDVTFESPAEAMRLLAREVAERRAEAMLIDEELKALPHGRERRKLSRERDILVEDVAFILNGRSVIIEGDEGEASRVAEAMCQVRLRRERDREGPGRPKSDEDS